MYRRLNNIPPIMFQEVITGTQREEQVVYEVKQFLEELRVDQVNIVPIPVLSWRDKACFLESRDIKIKCYVLPYSFSIDVEADVVFGEYINDRMVFEDDVSGKIVIVPFPKDPDDAKYVVLKVYENNAEATVFYDEKPGRYRRIVVNGASGFNFRKGLPPPIPAVSVRKEDILRIRKNRVRRLRLYVVTEIMHESIGYNVEAIINGREDHGEVLVTAHHDHWFTGFSDNLIGLDTILWVARKFRDKKLRRTIRVVSFTAEECGALNYASWYWSWGSRRYISNRRKNIDYIYAVINIDAVFSSNLKVSSNPVFYRFLRRFFNEQDIELDMPYFDSFMFTINGVPALTIHTFRELLPNYHTNLDDGKEVDSNTINLLRNIVYTILNQITQDDIYDLSGFSIELEKTIGDLRDKPLEALVLLYKFKILSKNQNKVDNNKIARSLSSKFIKTIYTPGIDGEFRSVFIPALATYLLLQKEYGFIDKDVLVAGEDTLLYPGMKIRSNSNLSSEIRTAQLKMLIDELRNINFVLDEILLSGVRQ